MLESELSRVIWVIGRSWAEVQLINERSLASVVRLLCLGGDSASSTSGLHTEFMLHATNGAEFVLGVCHTRHATVFACACDNLRRLQGGVWPRRPTEMERGAARKRDGRRNGNAKLARRCSWPNEKEAPRRRCCSRCGR